MRAGTGVSAFFVLSSGSTYTTTNPYGNSETVQDYEVDPAGIILDGTLQATGTPSSAHGAGENSAVPARSGVAAAPARRTRRISLPAGAVHDGALTIGQSTSQTIHQSGSSRLCY